MMRKQNDINIENDKISSIRMNSEYINVDIC